MLFSYLFPLPDPLELRDAPEEEPLEAPELPKDLEPELLEELLYDRDEEDLEGEYEDRDELLPPVMLFRKLFLVLFEFEFLE